MKHYKLVELLSIFSMSIPPHKRKAPYWKLYDDGSASTGSIMISALFSRTLDAGEARCNLSSITAMFKQLAPAKAAGCNHQQNILNRKAISRNTTHTQSQNLIQIEPISAITFESGPPDHWSSILEVSHCFSRDE